MSQLTSLTFRLLPIWLVFFCFSFSSLYAASPRPNILFLCVDDMKDWVNCLGGYEGKVHTPNIDRLADRGILFTNAHCASPKCAPSRAAVMTGLRPSTTGLYDNGHWWLPNLPGVTTIPKHFRNHGYFVAGAGKVFHHTAGNHPPNQWDAFQRITFQEDPWFRDVKLNYPWSQPAAPPPGFPFSGVAGLGHENDWGPLPIASGEYDDARTTKFAVNFLGNYGSRPEHHFKPSDADDSDTTTARGPASIPVGRRPFFLACGLFRPHLPWYVPQQFFDMYPLEEIVLPAVHQEDLTDLPAEGLRLAASRREDLLTIQKASRWKHAVRAYLASITCADARIGEVLDALNESKFNDNTVIIIWSDHGWHLGEKQHWHKSTLWEEATHVPLTISAPGFKPGICRWPVSLLDVFPTLNELAELPAIPVHEGKSLVPLLRDPELDWNTPAVIEYRRGNAAVRSERYRYIRYHDGGEELYDLSVDPHEWFNLAGNPELSETRERLSRWLPEQWAEAAPNKNAFHFDHETFRWTNRKTGEVIDGKD